MAALSNPGPLAPSAPRLPWAVLLWFGTLLLLCYAPVLGPLVALWQSDDDMAHGAFAPLVAGYIIWYSRAELLALAPKRNSWGAVLVVLAGVQLLIGQVGVELFLTRAAILVSLVGTVLFYLVLVLLIVLGLPFVFGYWVGKVAGRRAQSTAKAERG